MRMFSTGDSKQDKVNTVRSIGGMSYVDELGMPCPPTLDINTYNYKDETTGVPSNVTFSRASAATRTDEFGYLDSISDDVIRNDYTTETGSYDGWFIEESRTNNYTYSEDFSNAAYTKSKITISPNSIISPDNELTADLLVESSDTGPSAHYMTQALSVDSGKKYIWSVFAKPGTEEKRYLCLHGRPSAFGSVKAATFDLENGTYSFNSTDSTPIITYNNGFYRCSISLTATANYSGTDVVWFRLASEASKNTSSPSYQGDGVSGIYLWGAQFGEGSFLTSYNPTTTSAVTRAADNCSISGTNFTDFYNQSEGTLVFHVSSDNGDTPKLISINDGTINNRIAVSILSDNSIQCDIVNGGVTESSMNGGDVQEDSYIIGLSYKENDCSIFLNGSNIDSDNSVAIPGSLTQMIIGGNGTDGYINGHIKQITYFPRKFDDSKLQLLTSS